MTERPRFAPAEAFSLAEFLSDEMIARDWTTEDVAQRMQTGKGIAVDLCCLDLLMCIQDDNLLIGDDMFDGLARAFGVDPQYFRNLDAAWRCAPTERRSPFDPPEQIFSATSRRAMVRLVKNGEQQ